MKGKKGEGKVEKDGEEERKGHQVEIKGASEKEPEGAESL